MLPWLVFFSCLVIVAIVYFILLYQPPETIDDVYLRILRSTSDLILAFTYKKIGDNYENYYLNDDFLMEQRIEIFPVDHIGNPVSMLDSTHGIKSRLPNGFAISGIDFPFICPNAWTYNDDTNQCQLDPVCDHPTDDSYYRGISLYQFNEMVPLSSNVNYHPRLFVNCATDTTEACGENELYMGGERSLITSGIPCTPYDICSDRLTRTLHRFPTSANETPLDDNEYFICNNGVSQRVRCPENLQFSTIQMACVRPNICINEPDGTTFPTHGNGFIVCRGGTEQHINCPGNTILSSVTNQLECVNAACTTPTIIFRSVDTVFRIPHGISSCIGDTNRVTRQLCSGTDEDINDDPYWLQNTNFVGGQPIMPISRFTYTQPSTIFNTTTLQCEPFVIADNERYIVNNLKIGTHIPTLLPPVNINVFTGDIDYSQIANTKTYYKTYTNINYIEDDRTITTLPVDATAYANFINVDDDIGFYEFDDTNTWIFAGDADGIVYRVLARVDKAYLKNRSTTSFRAGYDETGAPLNNPDDLFFDARTGEFVESLYTAHSVQALFLFGFTPVGNVDEQYVNISRLFTHRVAPPSIDGDNFNVAVWTQYGAVYASATLKPGVTIDANSRACYIPGEPTIDTNQSYLGPDIAYVDNIIENRYTYEHFPAYHKYMTITSILEPIDITTDPDIIASYFPVTFPNAFVYKTLPVN